MFEDALKPHLAGDGDVGLAAGELDELADRGARGELIDGGIDDGAGDRGLRADDGDEDNVAGLELRVVTLVAAEKEVVEVEVDDGLVVALELDIAQAALWAGAAGGEQRVEQRAERADRERSGLAHLAEEEDLHGAQLAEVYVEVEVAVDAAELALQECLQLRILQAGDVNGADAGEGDVAGAVDGKVALLVDLAEGLHANLVAGAKNVVGRYGDVVNRREGGGHTTEETGAEDGEILASGLLDELLEGRPLIQGLAGDGILRDRLVVGAAGCVVGVLILLRVLVGPVGQGAGGGNSGGGRLALGGDVDLASGRDRGSRRWSAGGRLRQHQRGGESKEDQGRKDSHRHAEETTGRRRGG